MTNSTISIFGNKIFLEIINEMKLFSKFKVKYYEDLNLCEKNAEKHNSLAIFFVRKEDVSYFSENKINNFPSILITEPSISKKFINSNR